MDVEFFNAYIERLIQEIQELTKTKLLNETRIKYIESVNIKLLQKIEDFEKQVEKQSKKKSKEINISEDQF